MTLLHLLDNIIQRHLQKSGRAGYELNVLYVNQHVIDAEFDVAEALNLLKEHYPAHNYFELDIEKAHHHVFNSGDGLSELETVLGTNSNPPSSTGSLRALLSTLPSSTSRDDLIIILRRQIIMDFAKERDIKCVAWGDSTTRLAEKALSETAKGRGFSLPQQLSDGLSFGGVLSMFPMRDLLRKEIAIFAELTTPPLTRFRHELGADSSNSASSKHTSIDKLMGQYFESVEEAYPSIVSNVVRTVGKLQALDPSSGNRCQVCSFPIPHGTEGINGWNGLQNGTSTIPESSTSMCYGCARSFGGANSQL